MNPATATTVAEPPVRTAPGPFNPKPKKARDMGTDRSEAYNKLHNTEIANNHMLDRYLRNQDEMRQMGMKVNG